MTTTSTRMIRHINAPQAHVYRALLDPQAVAKWMVPNSMTSQVHKFDARVWGGTEVLGVHNNLPPGISPADNETGWQMALDKLAALVEAG